MNDGELDLIKEERNQKFIEKLNMCFAKCIQYDLHKITVYLRVPLDSSLKYNGSIDYINSNSVEGTYYKIKVKDIRSLDKLHRELSDTKCFDHIYIKGEIDDDDDDDIDKIYNVSSGNIDAEKVKFNVVEDNSSSSSSDEEELEKICIPKFRKSPMCSPTYDPTCKPKYNPIYSPIGSSDDEISDFEKVTYIDRLEDLM